MLTMMAHLIHLDGKRSAEEVRFLDRCAAIWFQGDTSAKLDALLLIRSLDRTPDGLESATQSFAEEFSWSEAIRSNAFDLLCSLAFVDGVIDPNEDWSIRRCAEILGVPLSEYERLRRLYLWRGRRAETENNRAEGSHKNTDDRKTHRQPDLEASETEADWHIVLGCSPDATASEIRGAYRSLVMKYHPDRLRAHGLPKEQQAAANARFIRIQRAFEEARRIRDL